MHSLSLRYYRAVWPYQGITGRDDAISAPMVKVSCHILIFHRGRIRPIVEAGVRMGPTGSHEIYSARRPGLLAYNSVVNLR